MGLAYAVRSAERQFAVDAARIQILRKLVQRSRAGEIGAIWTECGGTQVFLDVGENGIPLRRRMTWERAARIAAGENWRVVMGMELAV